MGTFRSFFRKVTEVGAVVGALTGNPVLAGLSTLASQTLFKPKRSRDVQTAKRPAPQLTQRPAVVSQPQACPVPFQPQREPPLAPTFRPFQTSFRGGRFAPQPQFPGFTPPGFGQVPGVGSGFVQPQAQFAGVPFGGVSPFATGGFGPGFGGFGGFQQQTQQRFRPFNPFGF